MYKYSSPDFRIGNAIRSSRDERGTGLIRIRAQYPSRPLLGARPLSLLRLRGVLLPCSVNRLLHIYTFKQANLGFLQ